ncbi:MAG: hypothetical protein DHS20C16_24040 [Phycisphaerae bacterium]|nr:MAG: hypothetical protein DHS20C16_24040 [Phycisphaerae bacterium]
MKYHVTGASRDTAEDIEMLVDAESEDAAAQTVAGMNVMVEKIEPAESELPSETHFRYEYHTLRCNFSDLQTHLNKYAKERWRVAHLNHDPHDNKSISVLMERIHHVDPTSKY